MIQWLGLGIFITMAWVQSHVVELRSPKPSGGQKTPPQNQSCSQAMAIPPPGARARDLQASLSHILHHFLNPFLLLSGQWNGSKTVRKPSYLTWLAMQERTTGQPPGEPHPGSAQVAGQSPLPGAHTTYRHGNTGSRYELRGGLLSIKACGTR